VPWACAAQQILRIIEHAGAVAELLADVDGEKREEVLAGEQWAQGSRPPAAASATAARF
jgi:hypothetical protein